jgi:hypothetical protein
MELGRCGSKFLGNTVVDFDGTVHDSLSCCLDGFSETSLEESIEDGPEDLVKYLLRCSGHAEYSEMSGQTLSDDTTTTSWRCSASNEGAVLYTLPFPFSSVEDTLTVDKHSQELDGGLSAVRLSCRHVDVIDEDGHLLAWGCAETHAGFFELFFDALLGPLGVSLCGEIDR